jgi:hypothetical protein
MRDYLEFEKPLREVEEKIEKLPRPAEGKQAFKTKSASCG